MPLGTRTETKNVNSLRCVERAVRYEITRQAAVSPPGERVVQETRHWHEDTGITTSGRVKSDAEDYRYFPEPDLVPVAPDPAWVEELRGDAARAAGRAAPPAAGRLGLHRPRDAGRRQRRRRCELDRGDGRGRRDPGRRAQVVDRRAGPPGQRGRASSWPTLAVTPAQVAELAGARRRGPDQRQAWPARCSTACSPARATRSRWSPRAGSRSCPTTARSLAAVDAAIAANPDVAEKIRDGKVAAAGALIGAVMKDMRGQADAGRVRELVLERLT